MSVSVIKRIVDLVFAVFVIPPIAALSLILLILNPLLNPGPLFFGQDRMGFQGKTFRIWKFRTMVPSRLAVRAVDTPLELSRITALGAILRRSHLDELPNAFNILRNEMALVGPRPDAWDHSVRHRDVVPYYRDRFLVRPGITGLAQVRNGYVETPAELKRKARLDSYYVRNHSLSMDIVIIGQTARMFLTGSGGR